MTFVTPDWIAPTYIHAISTTRQRGVSQPPFDSLNLGLHVQDKEAFVLENRQLIKTLCQFPNEPLWLKQVSGNTVIHAKDYFPNIEADACLTDQTNQVCVILTADCLPILVCHKEDREIAAIHAGWRGLASGIIQKTFAKLKNHPQNYLAWIAPCISAAHYLVRQDVIHAFHADQDREIQNCFTAASNQQWHADLVQYAKLTLQRLGVLHIYGGNHCTYSDPSAFFSARRDGQQTGRMASFIWMTND